MQLRKDINQGLFIVNLKSLIKNDKNGESSLTNKRYNFKNLGTTLAGNSMTSLFALFI